MKSITFTFGLIGLIFLTTTFSSLVSAWGFAAYVHKDCTSSNGGSDWVSYAASNATSGPDTEFSECTVVGMPIPGRPEIDCHDGVGKKCGDSLFSPAPLSVYYTEDADCCVGFSADCYYNTCSFHGDQCLWTEGMPGASSQYLTFKCKNKPVDRPMKVGWNGTQPISVPIDDSSCACDSRSPNHHHTTTSTTSWDENLDQAGTLAVLHHEGSHTTVASSY